MFSEEFIRLYFTEICWLAMGLTTEVRFSEGTEYSSLSWYPEGLWELPSLLTNGYRRLFIRELSGRGLKLTIHFQSSVEVKNTWKYRAYIHSSHVFMEPRKSSCVLFLSFRCGASVAGNDSVVTTPGFQVFWCTESKGRYAILTLNTGGKPTENKLNQ
jgi:hypothetical protein